MKRIPLTQGQFAIVDDEDFEGLRQCKWFASWNRGTRSFYAMRKITLPNGKRTSEYMHRRILGLAYGDKRQADHIDHQTLDNRRSNVRIVTPSENQHNRRGKGYGWNKRVNKFQAYIEINSVKQHLGSFDDPADARNAYLTAKRTYHLSAPCLATV